MSSFPILDDIQFHDKIVLLRADLNVPMHDGIVTDDERLQRLLPTLHELSAANAKIVILSHFGRPDGKADAKYSLRPVVAALEKIWGQKIDFAEDCIGPVAATAVKALSPGQILVLENTRFHCGEESNDPEFAKQLAQLGDIYINDAFSAAHRAHASTTGLAHLLPHAAGRLMEAELQALDKALGHPAHPVAAIAGGSKISTKLDLLRNLVAKVDFLILGGGIANNFLAAQGIEIGQSICEQGMLNVARDIMAHAKKTGCTILLPVDVTVARELKPNQPLRVVMAREISKSDKILDIGPHAADSIRTVLSKCKTVIWNGPLGAFEVAPFDLGTKAVAEAVAFLTRRGALISVAGGGDTVSALHHAKAAQDLTYVSTAGGAFLEWLEGKVLPGVAALESPPLYTTSA